jgi:predicted chitinase
MSSLLCSKRSAANTKRRATESRRLTFAILEDRIFLSASVIDLGTLGGAGAWAYDINNVGQVVGGSQIEGDAAVRAFLADAKGVTFDFEDQPATSPPRNGAYSTLAMTKSGLTLEISRPGSTFDIVDNNNAVGQGKPAPFGARSLDPFVNVSGTPFIFNFSTPVGNVSMLMGDYGQDSPDSLVVDAFSGPNATGNRVAGASASLPTLPGDAFNYCELTVSGSGIRSLRVIGGTPDYPNSTFIDRVTVAATSEIVPVGLEWNAARGGVDFGYEINVPSLSKATTIGLYWGNGTNALPDLQHPMFTYAVKARAKQGMYGPVHVPADKIVTAPAGATSLLVIADPKNLIDPYQDDETYALNYAPDDPLTVDQMTASMPGLPQADAERYVGPLNAAMDQFGISTLEQKAMFLGQLAHESANLWTWRELYNGDPDQYFINKYWVSKGQWTGLGACVPTTVGITLNIAHAKGAMTKVYELYWAQGPNRTDSGTLYGEMTFTYANGRYSANFPGAVPPEHTTHLLVVDPATNRVVQAIRNKLGNWSPQDATDFRGHGPIQITGRYNYQKFADYAGLPDLMIDPAMLADKEYSPLLGMQSAGWFWETLNNHRLNEVADSFAYKSSTAFNTAVTKAINGGTTGLAQRLAAYRRARSALLTDPNAAQSLYTDLSAAPALRGSAGGQSVGGDALPDNSPAARVSDRSAEMALASWSSGRENRASVAVPAVSAANAVRAGDYENLSAARLDAMPLVYPEKSYSKRAGVARPVRISADATFEPTWSKAAARTVDAAIAELSTTIL